MKKYLVPMIVLGLVGAGIFIRHEIVAPAHGAAFDMEAINGLTVGQSTEADLLRRPAFQKMEFKCEEGVCIYHSEHVNTLLSGLHLAPRTFFSMAVLVKEGMVTQVYVFMTRKGLAPIAIIQTMKMPADCASNPCVKRHIPPNRILASISILFKNDSDLRNRMPEAMRTECLSRMRGCSSYTELVPLAKDLNL